MLFNHSQRTDASLIVIFTIGSARVTGSIIENKEGSTRAVYTKQSDLTYQEKVDPEKLTRGVLSACMEVALDIQQNGLRTARERLGYEAIFDSFVCTFASPWFVAQTRMVTLKRQKAFVVKKQLIEALLKDEVTAFKEKIKNGDSEYALFQGAEVVDSYAIRTKLNGYVTKKPYGKSAQSITLAIYISLVSSNLLDQLQEMMHKVFHADQVQFYTSTLVSYLAVEQLFPKTNQEYLILEVNGEVTDVSIVKDEVLIETTSFPLGTNGLIRELNTKLKLSPDDIKSRVKMMLEGKTDRKTTKAAEAEKIIFEAMGNWMNELRVSLDTVAKGTTVPRTAYLMVDPVWELLYKTALKDHSSELFIFTNHPFNVLTADQDTLADHVEVSDGVQFLPMMLMTGILYPKLPNS